MKRSRHAVAVSAFLATILLATTALGVTYTYEGKGIGSTRIGWRDRTAASKLSRTYKFVKDTNYSYVVYRWYVGKRMSGGRYPIELYAKADHRVFRYEINSASYPTSAGIKIGSTVSELRSAYSNEKGPFTSGLYKRYTIKHKFFSYYTYTDFYCRSGRVQQIIVRR